MYNFLNFGSVSCIIYIYIYIDKLRRVKFMELKKIKKKPEFL